MKSIQRSIEYEIQPKQDNTSAGSDNQTKTKSKTSPINKKSSGMMLLKIPKPVIDSFVGTVKESMEDRMDTQEANEDDYNPNSSLHKHHNERNLSSQGI